MRNFIVTIDGKKYSVGVEEVEEGAALPADLSSEAKDTAPEPKETKNDLPRGGEELASPFPGLIKNLLVANGAKVTKNQPVIVLEAMKMDNDITAPCDGKINFAVAKGANVETGTVLAVIS